MGLIRIEKRKGVRYIVYRVNGKIRESKKWSRKDNLKDSIKHFKENNTIKLNLKKRQLGTSNNQEVESKTFITVTPKENKRTGYMVQTILSDDKGNEIVARSKTKTSKRELESAKQESLENAFMRLNQSINDGYDKDEGEKIFQRQNWEATQSIIYYETFTKPKVKT